MWHERLRGSGLWLAEWLRHQHRDDYWRHGSVCEDYAAIQVPVLAVSGWADGYTNAVFRLLAALDVPRKGLVGPWSHKYPHLGQPGPAVGFLQELVRWWDRWLCDADNGVMDEPMLRIWMQDSVPPSTAYEERPGRWVGEPSWPSPAVHPAAHPLGDHRILAPGGRPTGVPERLTVSSPLSVGQFAGKWCSYNAPPDLPYDQREEDGGSLVFDGAVLTERLEILGAPVVELEFAVDRPVAMVAVRLSDVAPDGRATRISYGLRNLTHRDGHERPWRWSRASATGCGWCSTPWRRRSRPATGCGWRSRRRTGRWPGPRPSRSTLTVFPGSSSLVLPVRPDPGAAELAGAVPGRAGGGPADHHTPLVPGRQRWTVTRDLVDYTVGAGGGEGPRGGALRRHRPGR